MVALAAARRFGARLPATRSLPATRALPTSRAAFGAKEPTSTEEIVYEWKYKGGGGVNHPTWWKVWCFTAVGIFVYENTYDFATRPCQVDVKIFGKNFFI